MDITHYFPIIDEDFMEEQLQNIASDSDAIIKAIGEYQFNTSGDNFEQLAFFTDNGDSFEVQRNRDIYNVTFRVIEEKKFLGLFPIRNGKMKEFHPCDISELQNHLNRFLSSDPEALLRQMKTNAF